MLKLILPEKHSSSVYRWTHLKPPYWFLWTTSAKEQVRSSCRTSTPLHTPHLLALSRRSTGPRGIQLVIDGVPALQHIVSAGRNLVFWNFAEGAHTIAFSGTRLAPAGLLRAFGCYSPRAMSSVALINCSAKCRRFDALARASHDLPRREMFATLCAWHKLWTRLESCSR